MFKRIFSVLLVISMMLLAVPAHAADTSGDYTLEYTIRLDGSKTNGFVFAGVDNTNFFFVQFYNSGANVTIIKSGGGSVGRVMSAANPAYDAETDTYAVKVVVEGTTATVYVDQLLAGSVTDSAICLDKFGFRHMISDADSAYYDDVKITAADGTVLYETDFSAGNPFGVGTLTTDGMLHVGAFCNAGKVTMGLRTIDELKKNHTGYCGDYTLEFDMKLEGNSAGLIFSAMDAKDYLCVLVSSSAGNVRILSTINEANSFPLNASATIEVGKTYHFTLKAVGTTVTVTIDDTLLGEFTSNLVHFGKIGFRHMISDGDSAYYDNLKLTAADGTVLFYNDFSKINPFTVGELEDGMLYVEPVTSNWRTAAENALTLNQLLENNGALYDLNGDFLTNTADVSTLLQSLNGNGEIDQTIADLNEDGKITLADALRLMKLLSK